MKKTIKRILCGALSLTLASVMFLDVGADALSNGVLTASGAMIENVTGEYDTTELTTGNFNSNVIKSSNVAPKYETRTVMISLKGDSLADKAGAENVNEYLQSWSAQRETDAIASQQAAFLKRLDKTGISYTLERTYNTLLNAVAIEVNTKHVSAIKAMEGVDSVVITSAFAEPETITTQSTTVVENETSVYATGIYDSSDFQQYGSGSVVAVLDTGLDYTHEAYQNMPSDPAWDETYIENVLNTTTLTAETRSGSLKASEVYISEKVPYAYDYADDDADVYPSYSNHGTHVAGIIGGYDKTGYTDKDGNAINETFYGVAPNCQLAIFKVFTDDLDDKDLGGAVTEDIVAALEDCVALGVDVINMSLGTSCGFTTTNDGDDEGELLNAVYEKIEKSGISLICAASNDYSSGYGGVFGTNLASNPDSGTVGSPSTFAAALSVASINGQKASYMIANNDSEENRTFVFYEESRDIDGNPFDFAKGIAPYLDENGEIEYVVVPGIGQSADYTSSIKRLFVDKNGYNLGRVALIKRGESTFQEKVEIAMRMGAVGVIIYNNVAGIIRMNLGEIENPVPSVSINLASGTALVQGATGRLGKLKVDESLKAGPFMSEFSSWGPTHDLKLKPEITAHGGEITSTVPGGYGEQSGTSMATPNMAGFTALVRNYIEKELTHLVSVDGKISNVLVNRLAMQLMMSTATNVYDQDNLPYSPRKQGSGVARLENVIGGTKAYLWTDVAENDYRPKLELGDDPERTGVYTLEFNITNFGDTELAFALSHQFMTETLAEDGLAVSEQAHMLKDNAAIWEMNGKAVDGEVTIGAGETATFKAQLSISESERKYIEESFENGMYVEGFLNLESKTDGQCDLTIPFLGFYGDWDDAPMLDYTAFEVSACEQDASILDEDKIQASIWETLPYATYYNEEYTVPMGSYVYTIDEDDDPMYADEKYCSVSRYNEYYGLDHEENYLTTTAIKAVYAGLLRNARIVTYKLFNEQTGELILEDEIYRVGKAYTAGGSTVPANVELELSPEMYNLAPNSKYKMVFEFYKTEPEAGEVAPEEDTYSFTFTVDYEAPVLEDVRVRYYDYKDGNKEKQRIYLDVDVYDNHYSQCIMLCYPTKDEKGEIVLQLATEYPVPVRNAKNNDTNTVSIEITDIYDYIFNTYNGQFYLQIDDYALNNCLYRVTLSDANSKVLPTDAAQFDLADGEENIQLDIYGAHKVSLTLGEKYQGKANVSNFLWTSLNPAIADVKNGEIVGISAGTTQVIVSNYKGVSKTINVTVSDKYSSTLPKAPSISFGVIQTDWKYLQKAQGSVPVSAGKTFNLEILTDPWYHPMTDLKVVWSCSNTSVATVENGVVNTLKKGTAIITANIYQKNEQGNWEQTLYSASVILKVQNDFTVSNYTLTEYNGVGYNAYICDECNEAWTYSEMEIVQGEYYCPDCNVKCNENNTILKIPTDMNIWYIGEESFQENNNIKRIILPASVLQIAERAFENCTALEEIYFVSMNHREDGNGNVINANVDWADISMVFEQAFANCPNLKLVDLSNVKTITLAREAFANCTSLSNIVDMPSIGTMHDYAFANCTSLTSLDLTGLHMSGQSVFVGCSNLSSITTGKFTAIGNNMFNGCTSLRKIVTLRTPKIGNGAFANCINLTGVNFVSPEGEKLAFDIGARAFENCGTNLKGHFTVNFGEETIRSIGDRAFAGSSLNELGTVYNLKNLGANAFANTNLSEFVLNDTLDFESIRLSGIPFAGLTLTVAEGSEKYAEVNGAVYNGDLTKLLFVNQNVTGEFVLPETVVSIGDYAFAYSNLSKVVLHGGVETLGVGAFENAKLAAIDFQNANLKEIPSRAFYNANVINVVLPETVVLLGDYAFAKSAIASFEGNGLKTIGNNAFEDCLALTTIALADGVKVMGDLVFSGCENLTTAYLPSVETLGMYTFMDANKLTTVVFGENAKTVGAYTFAFTPVKNVTLGENVTKIDEGAFYSARELSEITLPASVTEIGRSAFYNCSVLTTVKGLENLVNVGEFAFAYTDLKTLMLSNAKNIGAYAFANGNYTFVSMPVAENIGAYAFEGGEEISLELPASLQEIGVGAFVNSANLKTIKVATANDTFFVEDGALYRYVNKEAGQYELLCYPAACAVEAVDGVKTYTVKEGTVIIGAEAFKGLSAGAIEKIVLPHSIDVIGDSAFFESGISEYVFESIQAPVLEAIYRSEVEEAIKATATDITAGYYRGYYYANFETYFYRYTSFGDATSKLTIYYPENGVGYDGHIYKTYFGEKKTIGILMEDVTRNFVNLLNQMPEVSEVLSWKNWDKTEENKQKVLDFAEELKLVRLYYNNATDKADQAALLDASYGERLLALESAVREVRESFSIASHISSIYCATNSTHRTNYTVGEIFDMTGLVVTVEYDDGSLITADPADLRLVTTSALGKYDSFVYIDYADSGMSLVIAVTVTEAPVEAPPVDDPSDPIDPPVDEPSDPVEPDNSSSSSSEEEKGCSGIVGWTTVGTMVALSVALCKRRRREE